LIAAVAAAAGWPEDDDTTIFPRLIASPKAVGKIGNASPKHQKISNI
jgi:hypothetical protein